MMDTDWLKKLGKVYRTDGNDIYIKTDAKDIASAIKTLKDKKTSHITAITGIDMKKNMEIIYHFWLEKHMINIKTTISRETPKIMTITKEFPGALLFEMELAEMLGIQVEGIGEEHLLLAKDSAVYPLRRD